MDFTPGSSEHKDVERLLRMFALLEKHEDAPPDYFSAGALAEVLGLSKRRVGSFLHRYFAVGLTPRRGFSALALYARWDEIKGTTGVEVRFSL